MTFLDYQLPSELIAQTPVEPRDSSRLLVVHRTPGMLEHRHFREIGEYLHPGDLLIANQSRVIPARLLGRRAETGGAVEILLLAERPEFGADYWEVLVRPGRRLREGTKMVFGQIPVSGRDTSVPTHDYSTYGRDKSVPTHDQSVPMLYAEICERMRAGGRIVHFTTEDAISPISVRESIEQLGQMPLPPYIHEKLSDPERYQTVYARTSGSAAAPTAGLHFTPQLLADIQEQGVKVAFVTLHVGLDTFRPLEGDNFSEHKMHSEEIELDESTATLIQETRRTGGRVIAVGTTTVRVLESVAALNHGQIEPYRGSTSLFITPGYRFQVVDAMITNFHLPHSTLLLLVSAFAGETLIEKAYQEAIRERYRFFSFGDATLLL